MALFNKLFGKKGEKYYRDLGLVQYGFTAEEKDAICGSGCRRRFSLRFTAADSLRRF
jgi:hypothetical protein